MNASGGTLKRMDWGEATKLDKKEKKCCQSKLHRKDCDFKTIKERGGKKKVRLKMVLPERNKDVFHFTHTKRKKILLLED